LDRRTGPPEDELVAQWASILEGFGADDAERIEAVLDFARRAADQAGIWRAWSFLTLQTQLAAERMQTFQPPPPILCAQVAVPGDHPDSEWTKAKAALRERVGEIPFANWFDRSEDHLRRAVRFLHVCRIQRIR
jgi:hypothetical protein